MSTAESYLIFFTTLFSLTSQKMKPRLAYILFWTSNNFKKSGKHSIITRKHLEPKAASLVLFESRTNFSDWEAFGKQTQKIIHSDVSLSVCQHDFVHGSYFFSSSFRHIQVAAPVKLLVKKNMLSHCQHAFVNVSYFALNFSRWQHRTTTCP